MSDESISRREDKENLMYIYRKLQQEQYNQDVYHTDSLLSTDSALPIGYFESDVNLCTVIQKEIGPDTTHDPEMIAKTKPFVSSSFEI